MSEDWAEDVARLRDEVEKTAQRFENAAAQIEPVSASDATRSVSVTLDKAGVVQDVKVDAAWRKSLRAAMIGPAVQEAIVAAAALRTEAWATRFADESKEPDPPPRPMPPASESLAGMLSAQSQESSSDPTDAGLQELLNLVRAVNAGFDDVTTEIGAHLATKYAGRSSSGHVRATVLGSGAITELNYEQRWLEKAHHFNIGRETTEAIHHAHEKMANVSIDGIIDSGSLGEVLALAKDPKALAVRLRLRE